MQEGSLRLSTLMPCLNEAETVATHVTKAKNFLTSQNISGEVLVADNGSTDGSQNLAREAGAKVIQVTEKGYGSALLNGIDAARGEYIIMGDADDSNNFMELKAFLDSLDTGFDIVMGNRFMGGIKPNAMPILHRYLGNPVLAGWDGYFSKLILVISTAGYEAFEKNQSVRLIYKQPVWNFPAR